MGYESGIGTRRKGAGTRTAASFASIEGMRAGEPAAAPDSAVAPSTGEEISEGISIPGLLTAAAFPITTAITGAAKGLIPALTA